MKLALFDRFQIYMTKKQAYSVSHSGECYLDTIELKNNPEIRKQLDKISDKDLSAELMETGGWEKDDLIDRHTNELRILWIAGGNIRENFLEKKKK